MQPRPPLWRAAVINTEATNDFNRIIDVSLFRTSYDEARKDAAKFQEAYSERENARVVVRESHGRGSELRLVSEIPIAAIKEL